MKCEFWLDNVVFLGNIINGNGILVDLYKVKAIVDWPQSMIVSKVQSFLGLASYYRRFIHDFSKIAVPLIKLTYKGKPFI